MPTLAAPNFLRALPRNAEFLLVILIVFGRSLYRNVQVLFAPLPGPAITLEHLLFLLVFETTVLLVVGWFLVQRGWTVERLGLRPEARDVTDGLKLFGMIFAGLILYALVKSLFAAHAPHDLVGGNIDMLTIVILSLLNPVFEEVFECGYIVTFFADTGQPWLGVALGAAIRGCCHLYKGVWGAIEVGLLGLIFGAWYVKHRRLWPVIVVHMLFDFISLTALSHLASR
jgi:uncharacterized protein